MFDYLETIYQIVYKDLILEIKSKDIINSMLFYALIIIAIFSFILRPGYSSYIELSISILWISIIFSGVLGLNRAVIIESLNDSITALLIAPVEKSAIFFGKVISMTLFMFIIEIIILPIFIVFYNINIFANGFTTLFFILFGTFGFALIGMLFSFITYSTRAKELMLPLLLLPIIIPLLLSCIKGMALILENTDSQEFSRWLNILISFDFIFTLVIYMLADKIFED